MEIWIVWSANEGCRACEIIIVLPTFTRPTSQMSKICISFGLGVACSYAEQWLTLRKQKYWTYMDRAWLHASYCMTSILLPTLLHFFWVHLIFYKHMLCYLFFPIYTNHLADTILTYHSCNLARKYTPYLPKASAHMFLYRINNNNIRKI